MPSAATPNTCGGKHVVVIGLGNIGSPLVDLLARIEMVERVTLVDPDAYVAANLSRQAIQPEDIGKPKALAQAARARRIRPSLAAKAICAAVEDVPLGRFRGDVVLTGLDSKLSRQQVSERIWRLGVPWVDGGVDAAGWLARITLYVPGPDQPCLECAWDKRDYEALEVRRPCQAGTGATPTGAPAFLGALAAALLVAEATKVLAGNWSSVQPGTQLTMALASHTLIEMKFRRNPRCRFDHMICGEIRPLPWDPKALSLGELFADLRSRLSLTGPMRLHVEAGRFDRKLRCACGAEKPVLCLRGRMRESEQMCPRCGEKMSAVGFAQVTEITWEALLPQDKARTLAAIGLRSGDIITVKSGAESKAFELVENQKAEAA